MKMEQGEQQRKHQKEMRELEMNNLNLRYNMLYPRRQLTGILANAPRGHLVPEGRTE